MHTWYQGIERERGGAILLVSCDIKLRSSNPIGHSWHFSLGGPFWSLLHTHGGMILYVPSCDVIGRVPPFNSKGRIQILPFLSRIKSLLENKNGFENCSQIIVLKIIISLYCIFVNLATVFSNPLSFSITYLILLKKGNTQIPPLPLNKRYSTHNLTWRVYSCLYA